MKTFIMIAALTLASGVAMAEGGKHGKISTSPVFAEDQITEAGIVVDVPDNCTPLVAADHSQVMIWCGEAEED
jgi:hypothetical protein